MKTQDVNWVDEVPKWKELSAKVLWNKAKNNVSYQPYFPGLTKSKVPSRFMKFNIIFDMLGNIF